MRHYAFACKQGPLDIASETRPTAERSVRGHAIKFKTLSLSAQPLPGSPHCSRLADSFLRSVPKIAPDECVRLHCFIRTIQLNVSLLVTSIRINYIVIRMLNAYFNITHVTGIMFCITYIKIYLLKF